MTSDRSDEAGGERRLGLVFCRYSRTARAIITARLGQCARSVPVRVAVSSRWVYYHTPVGADGCPSNRGRPSASTCRTSSFGMGQPRPSLSPSVRPQRLHVAQLAGSRPHLDRTLEKASCVFRHASSQKLPTFCAVFPWFRIPRLEALIRFHSSRVNVPPTPEPCASLGAPSGQARYS